jgi:hypothetical protein
MSDEAIMSAKSFLAATRKRINDELDVVIKDSCAAFLSAQREMGKGNADELAQGLEKSLVDARANNAYVASSPQAEIHGFQTFSRSIHPLLDELAAAEAACVATLAEHEEAFRAQIEAARVERQAKAMRAVKGYEPLVQEDDEYREDKDSRKQRNEQFGKLAMLVEHLVGKIEVLEAKVDDLSLQLTALSSAAAPATAVQ